MTTATPLSTQHPFAKKLGVLGLVIAVTAGVIVVTGSIGGNAHSAAAITVNSYLQRSSPVFTGDATAQGYVGQVQLLSWQWDGSAIVSTSQGGGQLQVGRPSLDNVVIEKYLDGSTTQLEALLTKGSSIPTLTLTSVASNSGQPYKLVTVTMSNALVTSVAISGASDRPLETVKFAYAAISMATISLNNSGVAQTTEYFCYNAITNNTSTSSASC